MVIQDPVTSEWAGSLSVHLSLLIPFTFERGWEEGGSSCYLKGAHTTSSPDRGAQAPAQPSCAVAAPESVMDLGE